MPEPGSGRQARADADAARRRALRELARRHHPDRGGDHAEYVRRAAELERRFAQPRRALPDGRASMVRVEAAARWRLVVRRLRRQVRRWRRLRTARRRARVDDLLRGRRSARSRGGRGR
ncbi:hypothetical protein [Actinotalea sp. Marseille-Q4924]|uniref:hypothetical protein n=1 Tax=Actinotalea sp. Marseille-Q4924 TaxID=2866571 RepID=UPI001CE4AA0D|nr:hypothetical protein [Actinotalea sp. Marseille-Q4924]